MNIHKISTYIITMLMIATIFSFVPTVIADEVICSQTDIDGHIDIYSNGRIFAQEIKDIEGVTKFTEVKLNFGTILTEIEPDRILVGLSETLNTDQGEWEARQLKYMDELSTGWNIFNFPDYEPKDDDIYLMVGFHSIPLFDSAGNDTIELKAGCNERYDKGELYVYDGDNWPEYYDGTYDLTFKLYGERKEPEEYTLTTHTTGGGSINPSGGTYTEGTNVELEANPDNGWDFDHWEGEEIHGSKDSTETLYMDENKEVTAVFTEEENDHPTCSLSTNPSSGEAPLETTFSLNADDSDGTIDSWELDINNDGSAEYSGSGMPPSTKLHTYNNPNDYTAKLKVWDNKGAASSDTCSLSVTEEENNPPNKPVTPTGPSSGSIGEELSFTTTTTDPDGNGMFYGWDWNGDDEVDIWIGAYDSGSTVRKSHSWTNADTYNIKVKAKDENDAESEWSESLKVEITGSNTGEKYLAVILCGYSSDTSGPYSRERSNLAYNTFKQDLGYTSNQIYYLSEHPDNGVDKKVSYLNVEWVFDELSVKSGPNTQIFIQIYGHGNGDDIALNKETGVYINAKKINEYLNNIEYKYCTFLIHSCHAASFAYPDLSGPNRLVYTTDDEETTYSTNQFIDGFYNELSEGYSYGVSWMAGDFAATAQWHPNFDVDYTFNPQLDDNGDGISNGIEGYDYLPFEEPGKNEEDCDGYRSLHVWPSDEHKTNNNGKVKNKCGIDLGNNFFLEKIFNNHPILKFLFHQIIDKGKIL